MNKNPGHIMFGGLLIVLLSEIVICDALFNSYTDHPSPWQRWGQKPILAQMPKGQVNVLVNAQGPETEKMHIPRNFISISSWYCQLSQGWGKLALKCPSASNILSANISGCPEGWMVRVGIKALVTTFFSKPHLHASTVLLSSSLSPHCIS